MGDLRAAPFSMALLLAACAPESPAPETSEAATETTASAQRSRWPADYAAMRSAAAAFAQEHVAAEQEGERTAAAEGYPPAASFDIFSCAEPDADPGDLAPRETQLALLAHQSVLLEQRLTAAGYQPATWTAPVERLQDDILALLAGDVPKYGDPGYDAFENRLGDLWRKAAEELETTRKSTQADTRPITMEGGCGAAETPFLVKADPPGGRVWLTTRFTFQTCEALGKPAWDTAQCRWTEMDPDRQAYLSGNYMVQAQWPDGRTLRSTQRFQGDIGDPESEDPVVVAVRPG